MLQGIKKTTGETFTCTTCGKQCECAHSSAKQHVLSHSKQKKNFECKVCANIYSTKGHLQKHYYFKHNLTTNEGRFTCYFCPSKFKYKEALFEHLTTLHTKECHHKRYVCTFCRKLFLKPHTLADHIGWKHTQERPYKCTLCQRRFLQKRSLQTHMQVHQKIDRNIYKCPRCPAKFKTRNYIPVHIASVHEQQRDHLCSYPKCGKRFLSKSTANSHYKTVHNEQSKLQKLQCPQCPSYYTKQESFKAHLSRFHIKSSTVTCYFCKKTFRDVSHYRNHLLVHTKEKPFKCNQTIGGSNTKPTVCSYAATEKQTLINHINSKHNGKRGYFSCSFCDANLRSAAILRCHIILKHTIERPHSCKICGKAFAFMGQFNLHKNTHLATANKPQFPCETCGKVFHRKDIRKVHVKMVHLKLKNFKFECYFCFQKYKRPGTLENHINTHTLERPLKCSSCFKTFHSNGSYKSHIKFAHTMEQPFQCSKCNTKFKYKQSWRKHVMRVCTM